MSSKYKYCSICIILIFITLLYPAINNKSYSDDGNSIKFVYITDLNLYPTPLENKIQKHLLEKKYGLLIFETQAIFQGIVSLINQKLNPDFVVFGGNSISDTPELNQNKKTDNVWHLFQDMVSEIKFPVMFVFGKNELNSQNKIELLLALNSNGVDTENTWWFHKYKNFLLVGLDEQVIFEKRPLASIQTKWLSDLLSKNKNVISIIFLHRPLLDSNGNPVKNQNVTDILNTIKSNPQVRLVLSGNELIGRTKLINNTLFLLSPSPSVYPSSFNIIEVDNSRIKVKTSKIPLKGIIKKAEQYLIESDRAITQFPNSPRDIRDYVLGENKDRDFEYNFE